jgi:ABC-type amino acid transport substrate-binding protein
MSCWTYIHAPRTAAALVPSPHFCHAPPTLHDLLKPLLALTCAVGAAAWPAAAADLPEIKQTGTLRVIVMPLGPADEFFPVPVKTRTGFDRDVLDGFARLHRIKLEVVPVAGWDNLVPALLQGRGDVIAGRFTITEARLKQIAFTSEVFPSRNVVLTRKPHPPVESLEALKLEKVGTIRGSSMAEAVKAVVPAANIDDSLPPGGLPPALVAGKVTAVVLGIESAIAARNMDAELELGAFVGPPRSLAYGLRKQDTELLAALDDYVANVRKTTTWSRLVVEYFGGAAPEILRKARAN